MNRKYENTHCGEKGLSTSAPYIPIMKIKKDKDKFNRQSQKAYKDVSLFFLKYNTKNVVLFVISKKK